MRPAENEHVFGNVSRAVVALRNRLGWTQSALGARAALSRQVISRIERSDLSGITIGSLDRTATALGATLHVQLRWRGEQLDRLIDSRHAALQQVVAARLVELGWLVKVEASFNHYGDRGRIDIVAFQPRLRIMLIVEIKSGIGDIQETLGLLDMKLRLGGNVAQGLGWGSVDAVLPALAIGDSRAARRTLPHMPRCSLVSTSEAGGLWRGSGTQFSPCREAFSGSRIARIHTW